MVKKNIHFFALVTTLFLSFSCATAPAPQRIQKIDRLMGFEEGIAYLARDINSQFTGANQKLLLDSFLDANSGQALTINKAVEKLLTVNLSERFDIIQMDTALENDHIDYVLSGIYEYDNSARASDQKGYHFFVAVYELNSGIIRATSDALIEIPDYKPTSTYEDSPIFLRDGKLDDLTASVKRNPGEQVSQSYLSYLGTKSILAAAEQAYEKGDNEKTLKYYIEAEKRSDGKTMTVYSGLYNTARLLNQSDDAERYFGQLINTSINEKKRIEIKILFKVNSAYFIDIGDMPKHYGMWLRQITAQFQKRGECMKIVGHSSRTGKEEYNITLSKKRAQLVQQVLAVKHPEIIKKTEIVGMGYAENIVGSGTDDSRDAIDRRVEFRLLDCTK
jgi:outer membrane protein OmpA-like peptidoglycan-associated protein